jgi:hypothetical protein
MRLTRSWSAAAFAPALVTLAATLSASSASADEHACGIAVEPGVRPSTRILVNPVVDPQLVIDPDVSRQPTRPDLIRVRIPGTVVELDPSVNYERSLNGNRIDENHSLLRAQRLHNAIVGQAPTTGYVIRGLGHAERHVDVASIRPRMIIQTPGTGTRHKPAPEPGDIPVVPAPQTKPADGNPRLSQSDTDPQPSTRTP